LNRSTFFRRPFLAAGLTVLLGTWLSLQLPALNLLLRIAAWAVFLLTLTAVIRMPRLWLLPLLLGAFLNAEYRSIEKDPLALTQVLERTREHIEIQAELMTLPGRRDYGDGRMGPLQAEARVSRLRRSGLWQPVRGRIRLRDSSGGLEPFRVGDQLELHGPFDAGESQILPHPLQGVLRLEKESFVLIRRAGPLHFAAWCSDQRERCAALLESGLEEHPDAARIVQAVLLGYREGIPSQWIQHFAATGTLHVFAISGLHVGLVAFILIGVLRLFGLGPHQWVWPLLPLLVFYTVLTGAQPSAVRACVMAVTFWSALALKRKPDAPTALALAAVLMLAVSPDQLQSVGFIFSFLVVGGLLLFCGPVYEFLSKKTEPQFLPLRMNAWQRGRVFLENRVLMMLAVSATAWIVSAPLTAYIFNRMTPIALLGNLVVAPSAFLMIALGLAALVAGSLHPGLAVPVNRLNAAGIELLLGFIETLSELPFSNAYVKSPALTWVLGAFAVMILPRFFSRRQRIPLTACGLALLLFTAGLRLLHPPTLQVLPAARGLSLLLNLRGSSDVLIDTGGRMDSWSVIRRLRSEGVDQLEALVITHPDAHHYGGMAELADAMPIDGLLVAPLKGSPTYQSRISEFHALAIPVESLAKGWIRTFRGGVRMEVLHPQPAADVKRADDGALVFRLSRGLASVLLLGDASRKAQQAILNEGIHPGAGTLVVTGSGEELDPVFLAWCRPHTVIFTGPRPVPSVWSEILFQAGGTFSPDLRSVFRAKEALRVSF
jgi:competence protein ComEC